MFAPTVRATCGVPVTVTRSLNSTVTVTASPARKTPFPPLPRPESVTPATTGLEVSVWEPSTMMSGSSVTAWSPSRFGKVMESCRRPPASAIVPPFRVSAEAPTLTPFTSESEATTV